MAERRISSKRILEMLNDDCYQNCQMANEGHFHLSG